MEIIEKNAVPFLRWAGGKRWLLKDLHRFLPDLGYAQYHEPFIGGGAVFFYLKPSNRSFVSDLNKELIETYMSVKNEVEDVIEELLKFKNTKEEYYKIRQQTFIKSSKKAARFIYLNQTSFNGIYRVNLKGEYNVPYGYRHNHEIEYDNLREASKSLKKVTIASKDFSKVVDNVKKGDLVFIDPPYTVTHNDNGFIKYNQKIFSIEDQYRLAKTINEIKEIGAYYILTNAAHKKVREIFKSNDKVVEIKRASLIGGKNAIRGNYSELIITNTRS
jgi:DNA adenine methylase